MHNYGRVGSKVVRSYNRCYNELEFTDKMHIAINVAQIIDRIIYNICPLCETWHTYENGSKDFDLIFDEIPENSNCIECKGDMEYPTTDEIFKRHLFHNELIQAAAHPTRVSYAMSQCEDPEEYFNNI